MENGKKHFLLFEIKDKKFFLNVEFWIKFIEKTINDELIKLENSLKSSNISEDKKRAKKDEIILNKLISFIPSLNNFNLGNDSVNSILLPIINKFNINEEKKQYVFSFIDSLK